ncbi:hypothetical protein [Streptomyces shenzhenensis]|uniref:hypothetical protein n=1 Tax=Streptomyces shenzhenensis TaxID=943815 RepID=UPI000EF889A8
MPRSCVPPPVPHAPPLGALLRGRHFLKHHFGGGHAYALRPWIDGRHRHGGRLTRCRCGRLGALLGAVHACLERRALLEQHADRRPPPYFHPFDVLHKGDAPAAIVGPKVRAHARAYRRAAGATPTQLAAAVRRVWWERLDERGDTRADPRFPAASALAVCDAFVA